MQHFSVSSICRVDSAHGLQVGRAPGVRDCGCATDFAMYKFSKTPLHDMIVKTRVSLIECAQGLMRVPELVSMLIVHDDVEGSIPCRKRPRFAEVKVRTEAVIS